MNLMDKFRTMAEIKEPDVISLVELSTSLDTEPVTSETGIPQIINTERTKLKEFIAGFPVSNTTIRESLPDAYVQIESLSNELKHFIANEDLSDSLETLKSLKILYVSAIARIKPESLKIVYKLCGYCYKRKNAQCVSGIRYGLVEIGDFECIEK